MIDAAFDQGGSDRHAAPPPVQTESRRRVILVDGFNVLHAVLLKTERDSGWWKRVHRERLLRRLAAWPRPRDELWVAFDGAQPTWSVWAEPVAEVFEGASAGLLTERQSELRNDARLMLHSVYVESADDWIVRRARRTSTPDQTVVVSADRQVAGRARSAGCEVWTPWSLMEQCPDDG